MARPLRIEYPNAFYHVIQRGIEKKSIFLSDKDKERFLSYLALACKMYGIVIHTYTLMNNHYHLVIETPRANLSRAMHYINASYASYFNAKRKRSGPLYQGRFKAILVEQDEYLHVLSRYIHLNPVRANIVEDPKDYPWSSYTYFISNKKAPEWLNTGFILSMFNKNISRAKKMYKQFVIEAIGKEEKIIQENTQKGFILGNSDFVDDIINRFVLDKENPEIPLIRELNTKKEPTLESIRRIIEKSLILSKREKRRYALYLSRMHTQKTLKQIAHFCGRITDAGVSRAYSKTQKEREKNKVVDKILNGIEGKIEKSRIET